MEYLANTFEKLPNVMDVFVNSGATVLANACGPCCGMWSRDSKEENSIVSSYNRNFAKRNDGNAGTHNFLTNPELATAMAFSGKLDFNPEIDSIGDFQFQSPTGDSLPKKFSSCENIYVPPNCDGSNVSLVVKEHSSRLQLLEAFEEWDAEDKLTATVLIKTRGKCTTDHISAAGPWLKFRGHLLNISQNTLIGAVNDANGERNKVWNIIAEEYGTIPDTAAFLRDQGMKWVIVGDENYGEGSSGELAKLQPRFLGRDVSRDLPEIQCVAICTKISFTTAFIPLWIQMEMEQLTKMSSELSMTK